MISKGSLIVLYGLVALTASQYYGHSESGSSYALSNSYGGDSGDDHHKHVDYYAYPKYKFDYQVNDPHTGDVKAQAETRDGDIVTGFYTLHEPDGTILEVHYEADKKTGFNAKVSRKGKSYHPEVQKYEHHFH